MWRIVSGKMENGGNAGQELTLYAGECMIKAVIFDMDGTLIDSERIAIIAWNRSAKRFGFEIPLEMLHGFIGMTRDACMGTLIEHVGSERIANEMFEDHKVIEDELYSTMLDLKPGAREVVENLHARGLKLAVATSTRTIQAHEKFDRFGLTPYFDVFTCGDELNRSKPEPDIFLLAASRLGVDPVSCVVVEDSFNGVRAGHAAGMHTIMVPDINNPTKEIAKLAEAVVPALSDVEPKLVELGLLA